MDTIDRRHLLAAGAATALAAPAMGAVPDAPLTAADVIARIKAHIGVPWRDRTVDGIVYGDPATPVAGIATTMMATFDTLKDAVAEGKNLVISHEPTFWTHQEDVSDLSSNPLYRTKCEFMKRHNVVSFHFHDHWHALRPQDGIAVGMMRQLGWQAFSVAGNPYRFALPEQSLADLVEHFRTVLKADTVRVVGDPALRVRRVGASWGYFSGSACNAAFESDLDVLVIGETREWESVEYAQDAISAGARKALVVLGHVASEQWGMAYCAKWLKGFVPEVPVRFLQTREPFWTHI